MLLSSLKNMVITVVFINTICEQYFKLVHAEH